MQDVLDFLWNNATAIVAILLLISELLASIPSVESNSIFQLIVSLLKKFAAK